MALDDLLHYDEEPNPAPKAKPRMRPSRVIAAVAGCAVVAWLFLMALRTVGYAAPFVLIFTALLAGITLIVLVREVGARPLPETLRAGLPPHAWGYADDDGMQSAVRHWEMRLDWTGREGNRFASATQPALIEIIDERLRVRHGIDRRIDPGRARELLGPVLYKFVTEPVNRRMSGPELAALATLMEDL
jgi:hypothetical protein